ncbi:Ribulose-phosphate 3-epimerase [Salinivirga cyanobacteriivorans]|uniref:Ribulose-phosphate 3-epimerase n=2 Tax=Salinivirga cyanobacteriivorans TaxID=1307839 RepID=A0A0S2HXZ5_9BACT|nr:Ribulose-phosphate 3-epimerase [Salinivirga cyanobacteriivorans]
MFFCAKTDIMAKLVSPSMLSANFLNLENDIKMVNDSEADWFHLDVMDGMYVPNISFGLPIVKQINKIAKKPLDVHLMIAQPERYIKDFKAAGADILTIHYEASTHLHRSIQAIKAEGMKAGVAINPHTNVTLLEDVLKDIDMVLIMSVNPGFGGQKFIEQSIHKIKRLRMEIESSGAQTMIQVDGGVDNTNAATLYDAGADCLVAGSYVFKANDPQEAISLLKKA